MEEKRMEEQESGKRSPEAAFRTPGQPTPRDAPAGRSSRRAPKAAPGVTFQPPSATSSEPEASEESSAPAPSGSGSSAAPAKRARQKAAGTRTATDPGTAPQPPLAAPRKPSPRPATKPAPPAQPAESAPPAQPTKPATPAQPAESAPPAQPTKPPRTTAPVSPPASDAPAAPQSENSPANAARPARTTRPAKKAATKAPPAAERPIPTLPEPADAQPKVPGAQPEKAPVPRQPDPAANQPSSPVVDRTPAVQTPPSTRTPQKSRTDPWAKLVADPAHAPELLALAAVQTFGPRAAEWARRSREAYPQATTDGLARLAERQFLRFGSVAGLFAAAAGSYAPVALLGVNAITYAELILHVAAANGLDPTDRQRAVELLVLTQVHGTLEDAEAALASAEQPAYEEHAKLSDAVWRLGRMASAQAAAWTVVKGVNRLFPGTAWLAAIMTSRNGARTMGMRTAKFYSQLSQESGSRV